MFLSPISLYTVILSFVILSNATDIDKALQPLQYRQNVPVGTGASPSPSPTQSLPTSAATSSTISNLPTSGSASSPVNAQSTQSQVTITSSGTTVASSQDSTQTGQTSVTGLAAQTRSAVDSKSLTGPGSTSISTTPSSISSRTGSITQQVVTTVVSVSGSSTISSVHTTSKVVAAASAAASSGAPALSGSNGNSGSPGLSSKSKKIIGGVIGGVGGVILLGGLAVVAWRIWGRRRGSRYDDNDPMNPLPDASDREKTSSVSGRGQSPFRSTLDQYHNPAGPVNSASNF